MTRNSRLEHLLNPRFSSREEEKANHNLITDLSRKIGDLKGYDYAYNGPKTGMMIISYGGYNYLVTAEPLSYSDQVSLSDELKHTHYLVEEKERELEERRKEEDAEKQKQENGSDG